MQVVKRENIKKTSNFVMLFMFILPSLCNAQYRSTVEITDSTKIEMIQEDYQLHNILNFEASVNRNRMPIFCKWELDIQDHTIIPVKFRLGSIEYVDQLENKVPLYKIQEQ